MTEQSPLERAREDLVLVAVGRRGVTADDLAPLIERLEAALRDEIAGDVNRADRPEFPTGERPDLIVRTTRAIDIHIIEMADRAPYWVPEGGERL